MTTQIIEASQGLITNEMQLVAEYEKYSEEFVRDFVSKGTAVILKNNQRKSSDTLIIGDNLSTKVCTSFDISSPLPELADMLKIIKLSGGNCAIERGACSDLAEKREKILLQTTLPYGTVPIYQSVFENYEKNKSISKLTKKKILSDIDTQASSGVDFVILNASLTSEILKNIEKDEEIASDNAKLISYWMETGDKENPYFEAFDEVLDILRTYDVALCLELSCGNLVLEKSVSKNQLKELMTISELVEKARNSGVQVFVNIPSFASINNADFWVKTVKKLTLDAPLMSLEVNVLESSKEYLFASKTLANAFFANSGVNFIQSAELPKTTGYFNAKQLKESIESALVVAKSVDYAKNNKKVSEFEAEYLANKENKEKKSAQDFIKKLFS